jgi:NAD(P)-dependent dehydrogenase (short-subunit alcohol dehydrogenase family)
MAMLRRLMSGPGIPLDVVRASNAELVQRQPLVAVFVGGTSGIGEYSVLALARTHGTSGKGLRLYIVGRNEKAAERTIAECRQICPAGHFEFVKANDLALLKDVDDVCARLIKIEEEVSGGTAKIDILVMTQAYLSLEPRNGKSKVIDSGQGG